MNDLSNTTVHLPATIEDLSKFVLVGREKLVAVKAEIRAIDKLELAKEVSAQKEAEAQMLAEALLDAETKLGEMMGEIPKASGARTDIEPADSSVERSETKTSIVESLGFTMKQAERFETLAENPDIVEQVKAEARETDSLPTRTRVLSLAQARKNQYKRECEELDMGFLCYKHLNKAYQEMIFVGTDVASLKTLMETIGPEDFVEEIANIDEMATKLAIIRAALMKGVQS